MSEKWIHNGEFDYTRQDSSKNSSRNLEVLKTVEFVHVGLLNNYLATEKT